jgi:hypothetical protein
MLPFWKQTTWNIYIARQPGSPMDVPLKPKSLKIKWMPVEVIHLLFRINLVAAIV